MKKVVIDASTVLSLLLPDEKAPSKVEIIFKQFTNKKIVFVAPTLLKVEFSNALRSNFLRKRLTKNAVKKAISVFNKLEIKYQDIDIYEVTKIAIQKDLSAYDSCYVYLAKENKVSLVSLDKKLQAATK